MSIDMHPADSMANGDSCDPSPEAGLYTTFSSAARSRARSLLYSAGLCMHARIYACKLMNVCTRRQHAELGAHRTRAQPPRRARRPGGGAARRRDDRGKCTPTSIVSYVRHSGSAQEATRQTCGCPHIAAGAAAPPPCPPDDAGAGPGCQCPLLGPLGDRPYCRPATGGRPALNHAVSTGVDSGLLLELTLSLSLRPVRRSERAGVMRAVGRPLARA